MARFNGMFLPGRLARGLLVMVCTAGCGQVLAAESRFEVTPFVGYRAGGHFKDGSDNNLDLNASSSAALAFNWRATDPGTQYELLYSRQSTQTDGAAPITMKLEYLQIGGTADMGDADARVTPFAAGGLGATRFSPGPVSLSRETRWSFNLGGGVRVPLTPHIRLRFEARGYLTWLGGDANLFCNGGCTLVARSKTFFQYEALGGVSIGF
jgi:opacity protein-like surface antigen